MNKNTLSAVSLFSGAGGMDIGFVSAGFDVLIANDIDPDACATYELNHSSRVVEGDLVGQTHLLNEYKGVDMLFGGPPCQGFSVAGKMDPNDERSKLLLKFFDVVDLLKPTAFVCENVKALAQLEKWSGIRQEVLARAAGQYNVAMVVLTANDFGVPQRRERVFCIGIHKSRGILSNHAFDALVRSMLDKEKRPAETVRQIIQRIGRAGTAGNREICNAKITFARAPILRKSPYAGMLFNGAGRPLSAEGYAPTLPASMGGNKTPIVDEGEIFDGLPSFVEEYHSGLMAGAKSRNGYAPDRLRRLTVGECLRFQTFPETYKLAGRQSAKYRQIGNAVPSKLAEAVAKVVHDLISQESLEEFAERTSAMKIAAE
ncbi:MAG: DNA (cytosine-5-)-methyltransferase [Devosia marina]|uniref:DNA cytosine methyltransferase n=1 Tax=Devosia marina TaxID=2683198 RepID=UPI0032F07274